MARKQRRASSGAPGFSNGMGGPSLNPIGLQARASKLGQFLDPTVAKEAWEQSNPWVDWLNNEQAQMQFSQPVRPRHNVTNGGKK